MLIREVIRDWISFKHKGNVQCRWGGQGRGRSSGDRDKQRQTKLDVAGGRKTSKHRKRSRRGRNTITSEGKDWKVELKFYAA